MTQTTQAPDQEPAVDSYYADSLELENDALDLSFLDEEEQEPEEK